jgi:hypothetical protein
MRERNWTAEAAEQLAVAIRASLGVWRIAVRGEQRAVSRALEPTEQVLAVAGCSYEIVRHGVVARRSMGALVVVTDRRLLFATKFPLRPARVDEVTRPELRDATMEADASDRRVVVVADAIRIALRPMFPCPARSLSSRHLCFMERAMHSSPTKGRLRPAPAALPPG